MNEFNMNDNIVKNNEETNLDYWANANNNGSSQIILHPQESLPEIHTIKKIYMTTIMGRITMQLDDGERIVSPGIVIDLPGRTKMKIKNMSSYKPAILVMKL